jgi:hypothetical protein
VDQRHLFAEDPDDAVRCEQLARSCEIAPGEAANHSKTVSTVWGAQTRSSCKDADSAATADATAYGTDHAEKLRG